MTIGSLSSTTNLKKSIQTKLSSPLFESNLSLNVPGMALKRSASTLKNGISRIDCAAVARTVLKRSRDRIHSSSTLPKVCAVQIGQLASWTLGPARHARRTVENELRGTWETKAMEEHSTMNELLSTIAALNVDESVNGVVIMRPVPENLSIKLLQQAVDPRKDVEGMHPGSIGKLVYGNKSEQEIFYPCTAKAAVEVLKAGLLELGRGDSLQGIEALVVGNSDILAKPITSILHGEGATVTVCNPDVVNFAAFTRSADVVFCAANSGQGTIRGDMLKPESVVIDLGMNVDHKGNFLGGDADVASCLPIVSRYSSLNCGIGLVRSAILANNLSLAFSQQNQSLLSRPY